MVARRNKRLLHATRVTSRSARGKAERSASPDSDGRQSEFWHTDDAPKVTSNKPVVSTKGTPTGQSIWFKCTDTNPEANRELILALDIEVNGFQWSYAPLYDFFIMEYKVTNVSSDTLEDVFMAFRYDVDVSSSETGTAN